MEANLKAASQASRIVHSQDAVTVVIVLPYLMDTVHLFTTALVVIAADETDCRIERKGSGSFLAPSAAKANVAMALRQNTRLIVVVLIFMVISIIGIVCLSP